MGQLQEIAPELSKLGYQVLALSPDRPEKLREFAAKSPEGFRLLSDRAMDAARAFGIAFRVDDELAATLAKYGIDLEERSGNDHRLLPVPAVFVIDAKGKIAFQYVHPDYRTRLDPDVLLAAARAAAR